MTPLASVISEMHQITTTPTEKSSRNVVFIPMALIYLDNTPWFIISNSSEHLVLPMVCVLQSLNRSTSNQSRSHGDVPITSMLLDRCYLQINGWTNWQPHMSNLLTMLYSRPLPISL